MKLTTPSTQMGDPTFVPGKAANVGSNANKPGVFERQDTAALDAVADKTQSFCDNGDTFCASGASLATHLGYVREFGDQATDFIVSKVQ
jgi:acetylxylan esterase